MRRIVEWWTKIWIRFPNCCLLCLYLNWRWCTLARILGNCLTFKFKSVVKWRLYGRLTWERLLYLDLRRDYNGQRNNSGRYLIRQRQVAKRRLSDKWWRQSNKNWHSHMLRYFDWRQLHFFLGNFDKILTSPLRIRADWFCASLACVTCLVTVAAEEDDGSGGGVLIKSYSPSKKFLIG